MEKSFVLLKRGLLKKIKQVTEIFALTCHKARSGAKEETRSTDEKELIVMQEYQLVRFGCGQSGVA